MNSTGPALQCHHADLVAILEELRALDHLRLPAQSLTDIRAIRIRRIARRIEDLLPHHKGHGERTARYALALGEALGLSNAALGDLHFAALLHDIGLLTVPVDMLSKAGPLTSDEYAVFQSHPRIGAELLEPIRFLREAALLIAHHHERWDAAGYPYGLRGEFIPLGSRILAVADAFDTLLVRDARHNSSDLRRALHLLQVGSASQFDPKLLDVFVTCCEDAADLLCRREDGRHVYLIFPNLMR